MAPVGAKLISNKSPPRRPIAKRIKMNSQYVLKLDKITARLRDRWIFPDSSWEIFPGQNWAVLGPNGAGKTSLIRIMIDELPTVRGSVYRKSNHAKIGYVSFELHEWFIRNAELPGSKGNKARDVILSGNDSVSDPPGLNKITGLLGINHTLQRDISRLSNGEMRKLLIARALLKSPDILVLDEPFGGLDKKSRLDFSRLINTIAADGTQVILVTNRPAEILPCITHVLLVKDCRIWQQGKRGSVLTGEILDRLYAKGSLAPKRIASPKRGKSARDNRPPLVNIINANVQFGDTPIIRNLSWAMHKGENWAITGPNGAGKTTLLNLITGDNLQGYSNEVYLFGKRKGSGETFWDIKERIGYVSPHVQIRYRKDTLAYDVVGSGFFESSGLYRHLSPQQHQRAREWMERLGIGTLSDRLFDQLSYGEKRMVMVARSVVKGPELLILDEPCEGLNETNREIVFDIIGRICKETLTNIIYVTHYEDELPACITDILTLEKPKLD